MIGTRTDNKNYMESLTPIIEIPDIEIPDDQSYEVDNINLGIVKRPKAKVTLQKHITGSSLKTINNDFLQKKKLTENEKTDVFNAGGWSYQPRENNLRGGEGNMQCSFTTLNNWGSWKFESDLELLQGSELKVAYEYEVKNESEPDYLGNEMIAEFKDKSKAGYMDYLEGILGEGESFARQKLGNTYYTGRIDLNVEKVPTKIGKIRDYKNNLQLVEGGDFDIIERDGDYNIIDINGTKKQKISLTIESRQNVGLINLDDKRSMTTTLKRDISVDEKKLKIDDYRAQLMDYYNAAASLFTYIDLDSNECYEIPGNLEYIRSYNMEDTLGKTAEPDEYQAEDIIITMNTGEDRPREIERVEWLQNLRNLFTRSLTYPTPVDVRH